MNKFSEDSPINNLTRRIIAMEIHRTLGCGFQEIIYQRALGIELGLEGIPYIREQEMQIFYKGNCIGTRRVDFLVQGEIMVEIKAVHEILPVHKTQAINYCEAYHVPHGLLLNFGATSLEVKRVFNKNLN